MLNGFINLYKNQHITSNKALSILKTILKQNNIQTKVGHFGTLDPDAEGVLPVALGRATRLFDYMLDKKKIYYSVFQFGVDTDTLDASGKILCTNDKISTIEEILKVIPRLCGEIMQIPPDYSAKSINGERAYKLARLGQEITLQPKKVTIYSIELLEELGSNCFSFRIVCSGGTYIRAIARDMAKEMDTVGIMKYLKREASGDFSIENSITMEELQLNLTAAILPMEYPLEKYPKYVITDEMLEKPLFNGIKLDIKGIPEGLLRVYFRDIFIGLGAKDEQGKLGIKTWLL